MLSSLWCAWGKSACLGKVVRETHTHTYLSLLNRKDSFCILHVQIMIIWIPGSLSVAVLAGWRMFLQVLCSMWLSKTLQLGFPLLPLANSATELARRVYAAMWSQRKYTDSETRGLLHGHAPNLCPGYWFPCPGEHHTNERSEST